MKKQIFTIILLLMGGVSTFGQSFKLDATGANDLRLRTSATDRLTILPTSGNVGIGTTTPDTKLEVYGDFSLSKYSTISAGTYNALDRFGASFLYTNSSVTINGIAGGKEGLLLYLVCGVLSNVTINPANGLALPSDVIFTNTDAPVTITGRGGAIFIYQVSNGWRLISYAQ